MGFYSNEELKKMRFGAIGENVLISKNTEIFGHKNISIGDNVRIDSGCKLLVSTGLLDIGNFVHLACDSRFLCSGEITINDFAQVAMGCTLLSASDSFTGAYLIGPTVPDVYRSVYKKGIILDCFSVVGAHSVLSPGTILCDGAALGAMSMTRTNQVLNPDSLYVGVPAAFLKKRSTEGKLLAESLNSNNL